MQRVYSPPTTQDEQIAIITALKFQIPHARIQDVFGVTRGQIEYARDPATPQKSRCGVKAHLRTPQHTALKRWLHLSPSNRRIPFQYIPQKIPELQHVGTTAVKTAFDLLGYCRRTSKKKGFPDDLAVCQLRLAFA